jgi:DNA-directed RNA polymerase subunit RPC12/RpoP
MKGDCVKCPYCSSEHIIKKGTNILSSGTIKQRYRCKDCGEHFTTPSSQCTTEDMFADEFVNIPIEPSPVDYHRSHEWLQSNVYQYKRLVITSAQNNTEVSETFLKCIKSYCEHKNAGLVVIPTKYRTVASESDIDSNHYDERITEYLCENTLTFNEHNIKIYAGIKIQATAENPLAGLDPLSKGWTVVVGHAQVQLKTLPNLDKRISDILTTTGAITVKNYSNTKLGEKARFNHSMSALVIELDDGAYHLRHLNYDPVKESFWDLDTEYRSDGSFFTGSVSAIVTGDEHALFRDPIVEKYTYTDDKSIVNTLRPEYIVRHDVLDFHSGSHHHKNNIFTQYAKWKTGYNDIEKEIRLTIDYINDTTPDYATSLIVQSNHNEHLLRWLNEADIKNEPWNAKLYHYLMFQMLEHTDMDDSGTNHPDPFELISRPHLKPNVSFVSRDGRKIHNIQIGSHGDRGINGARGSAAGFARIPDKMIVGHSHSPAIQKGCYVVGTSSRLALEYNKGASTWHHAHCIIHSNGKRQMIFVTPKGWRLG